MKNVVFVFFLAQITKSEPRSMYFAQEKKQKQHFS
jgi:hypothetical protein